MELSYYEKNKPKIKQYYLNNKEKLIAYQKQWVEENPERQLWLAAKARARYKNLKFNIKLEDVIIPEVCPVFKVPLIRNTRYAPSLDRKDSSKGYVKGNVWIISKLANSMKNDGTAEELKKFGEWCIKTYA